MYVFNFNKIVLRRSKITWWQRSWWQMATIRDVLFADVSDGKQGYTQAFSLHKKSIDWINVSQNDFIEYWEKKLLAIAFGMLHPAHLSGSMYAWVPSYHGLPVSAAVWDWMLTTQHMLQMMLWRPRGLKLLEGQFRAKRQNLLYSCRHRKALLMAVFVCRLSLQAERARIRFDFDQARRGSIGSTGAIVGLSLCLSHCSCDSLLSEWTAACIAAVSPDAVPNAAVLQQYGLQAPQAFEHFRLAMLIYSSVNPSAFKHVYLVTLLKSSVNT